MHLVAAGMGMSDDDDSRAGSLRREDSRGCVLKYEALVDGDAEPLGGKDKAGRIGFALGYVARADQHRWYWKTSRVEPTQRQSSRCRGDDRPAMGGQSDQERTGSRDRRYAIHVSKLGCKNRICFFIRIDIWQVELSNDIAHLHPVRVRQKRRGVESEASRPAAPYALRSFNGC